MTTSSTIFVRIVRVTVLLVTLYGSGSVCGCPAGCFCTFDRTAVCHGATITTVPANLPWNTREIQLKNCTALTTLPTDIFARYMDLEEVLISNAVQLKTVQPFAFRGLPRLKSVIMKNTGLTELATHAFSDMQSSEMKDLILTGNQIQVVHPKAFDNSRRFRTIDLRRNPLKVIKNDAFSGLYHVDFLELASDLETELEPSAFHNMMRLHFMHLKHWHTKWVQSYTFRGLKNAKGIWIEEAHLGIVKPRAFADLETVEYIKIENSTIRKIKKKAFDDMQDFGTLHIKKSHIQHMDQTPQLVHMIKRGSVLLDNNRIDCRCGNRWLADDAIVPASVGQQNFCYDPPHLRGYSLAEARHLSDMQSCFDDEDDAAVSVAPQSMLMLLLVMLAVSMPFSVNWSKP